MRATPHAPYNEVMTGWPSPLCLALPRSHSPGPSSATHAWLISLLMSIVVLFMTHSAFAQSLRIDITGVGDKQIPIALPVPAADPAQQLFAETVKEVAMADLFRTGAFSLLPVAPQTPPLTEAVPQAPELFLRWRTAGADALVASSVRPLPDGRVELRFRLLNTIKSEDLGGLVLATAPTTLDARRSAHRMADFIYEKLTGEPGFFSTRLAFVRKEKGRQVLVIADSDGENAQPALRSDEPIISLTWSPDGTRLAYVSFESGKPVVYSHELATGKRTVVANYRGSNSSPAWSPDGQTLAVTLTKDGSSQIYITRVDGTGLRRLTQSGTINTEPTFSSDGRQVFFTSDRGGSAQIYRIPTEGGTAERVSFNGPFNARPVVSPDGRLLAFVSRQDSRFRIAVRNLSTNEEILVSDGPKDDSPSFSPSSRWIIFSSRINGRDALSAVSTDGKVRTRISLDTAGIRNPAWGRFPD